jgi:hypothetical protein
MFAKTRSAARRAAATFAKTRSAARRAAATLAKTRSAARRAAATLDGHDRPCAAGSRPIAPARPAPAAARVTLARPGQAIDPGSETLDRPVRRSAIRNWLVAGVRLAADLRQALRGERSSGEVPDTQGGAVDKDRNRPAPHRDPGPAREAHGPVPPGKTTLTSKLPGSAGAVQRQPSAPSPGPAPGPRRSAWDQTMDPDMDFNELTHIMYEGPL